jgi:hypothetical protein
MTNKAWAATLAGGVAATAVVVGVMVAPTTPCVSHSCANDSLTPPVVGDEVMRWDPANWSVAGTMHKGRYDIVADGTVCDHVLGAQGPSRWVQPRTWWLPYASPCPPALGQTRHYSVAACWTDVTPVRCSAAASQSVEFVGMPYCCFEPPGCERVPCYGSTARCFPSMRLCA